MGDIDSASLATAVALASVVLLGMTMGLAGALRLEVSRSLVSASLRAAVQLVVVGLVLAILIEAPMATAWAWLWVVAMVVIAVVVVARRTQSPARGVAAAVLVSVGFSVATAIVITFGFDVFVFSPTALIVLSGITIGNAVPSAALGVNQATKAITSSPGSLDAALALGFTRRQVVAFFAPEPARSTLIPQIERTKVVGLIALPGAMTGLLLAGVSPIEAALVQLLVMLLVLGSTALCAVMVVAVVVYSAVDGNLTPSGWTHNPGHHKR